jgi:endonuclease-3
MHLDGAYGQSHCSLDHKNPFELLVATILSAQCTDARVNMVTPSLFQAAPTPQSLADLPIERIEELVRTTGFFRNKAKNIRAAAKRIADDFGGQVPVDMEDLLSLAGVARKTANVVRGTAFGLATGVVVDTHVIRISRLLGLTKRSSAVHIERDLMQLLPQEHWIRFTHQIIEHGRSVCIARRPRCSACVLAPHCPSALGS